MGTGKVSNISLWNTTKSGYSTFVSLKFEIILLLFYLDEFCIDWTNCASVINSSGNILDVDNIVNALVNNSFEICETNLPSSPKILPHKLNFWDSKLACAQFKSELFEFHDSLMNTNNFNASGVGDRDWVWTGFSDHDHENEFLSVKHVFNIDKTNLSWSWGEPNGNRSENCAGLKGPLSNHVYDISCDSLKGWTVCNIGDSDDFTAYGLSLVFPNIKETFIVSFTDEFEAYSLTNIGGDIIVKENDEWILSTKEGNKILKLKSDTSPFGKKFWNSIGNTDGLWLTLNSCNQREFGCMNGTCLPKELRCDEKPDCADFEDEIDCSKVLVPRGYNKHVPITDFEEKVDISFVVDIKDVVNMDVNKGAFTAQVKLLMNWQDTRLTFKNLQMIEQKNSLSPEELLQIWIPDLVFKNTLNLVHSNSLSNTWNDNLIMFLSESNHSKCGELDFCYDGSKVTFKRSFEFTLEFLCKFDWKFYPFDSQSCPLYIHPSQTNKKLLKLNVTAKKIELTYTTFMITLTKSIVLSIENENEMLIELKFSRNVIPITLNTFLPTIILTIINQLSNYFLKDMFETIIMVNATVLMTLAALLVSVFNNLPQTTYIKMMDVWIITVFVYPFIIILVHTQIHILNRMNGEKIAKEIIKQLRNFTKIILPLIFMIFTVVYFFVGFYHQL